MGNSEDLVIVNTLMRQALTAVEKVMGKNGLNAVLRMAGLEQYVDNLSAASKCLRLAPDRFPNWGK